MTESGGLRIASSRGEIERNDGAPAHVEVTTLAAPGGHTSQRLPNRLVVERANRTVGRDERCAVPSSRCHDDAIGWITVIPIEVDDVEPRTEIDIDDGYALHRLHRGNEVIE